MNKDKLKQTAQDWIEADVLFSVYDDVDAMHDVEKLADRFLGLSDDSIDVQTYVKENMEREYKDTVKKTIESLGTYPDDMENTPSDLLFKPDLPKKKAKQNKNMKMTEEEKQGVCNTVDNEGFDYAFRHYSAFDEIEDDKFHELIDKYAQAADELEQYIDWEKYQP